MAFRNSISGSIVVGQTTSNALFLDNKAPVALVLSGSVVTGTKLSFLVSNDDATYLPMYDETSTEFSLTVTNAARVYSLPATKFWGWNSMKVYEGVSASAVAQATYNVLFDIVLMPV